MVCDACARVAARRWFRPTNFLGVRDPHGPVRECRSDFNSAMVTGDALGDSHLDRQLFCGAGSVGAKDTANSWMLAAAVWRWRVLPRARIGAIGSRSVGALALQSKICSAVGKSWAAFLVSSGSIEGDGAGHARYFHIADSAAAANACGA